MNLKVPDDTVTAFAEMPLQKWGALGSLLLATAFLAAPLIYLTGELHSPMGPLAYTLADFLYGPAWAAGLVTAVVALRERLGEQASRRMSLALTIAVLAAGSMVLVACIRSANRGYHLMHPELQLETSTTVLVVWATLVAGVAAAGWHFLGWALLLLASAGWTSGCLPRGLCALYLVGGAVALLVYLLPSLEEVAATLGVAWAVWQSILLTTAPPTRAAGHPAAQREGVASPGR